MTRSSVLLGVAAALALASPAASAPWGWPGWGWGWPWGQPQAQCSVGAFQKLLASTPGAVVERAVSVPEGGSYGEGASDIPYPTNPTGLPALCAVTVRAPSSAVTTYRFGLFLPSSAKWNERFLAVGNGGFAGGINWLDMGVGPHYGFATVSTDTGHNSSVIDLSWAYNAPEKRSDWGWRALHLSVVLGKQITEAYYGRGLKYSYYNGCSTGGRQGLREIQEFPDSFDGALIGAPSWQTSHINNFVTKLGMYNLPVGAPNYIPPSLFPALAAEVVKQCDEVDHVKDGIVSTLDECQFDYAKIRCGSAGVNASACLTDAQIQTAKNIYMDDYAANGTLLANSYSLSSELQWPVEIGGTEPSPFGVGYQRYFVLNDPDWDWHNYNDSLIDLAVRTDPGESTADKYDISAFKGRGGKVFMYHGIADAVVPPRGSVLYYNRTIDTFGGLDHTKEFFRLFLIPGMQHCWTTVTDAPWHIAGAFQSGFLGTDVWSVPGFKDKNHDSLLALMDWVEQRNPVDSIVATTWKNPGNASSGVLRQRPLCPWPQKAVYDNRGDVNSASSWSCKSGGRCTK